MYTNYNEFNYTNSTNYYNDVLSSLNDIGAPDNCSDIITIGVIRTGMDKGIQPKELARALYLRYYKKKD